jgi:phosphonoacetate hydrolase
MPTQPTLIRLHDRTYAPPSRPLVVVCIDGCDPAYIDQGLKDSILPHIQQFLETGFGTTAEAVVPTFTNPNNLSIVTGSLPLFHGISGNYFLDPISQEALMLNEPAHVRSATLPALFSQQGHSVVIITAKDKLRRMLGYQVQHGICFSSERANSCTIEDNGISQVPELVGRPQPEVYSADLSLFVLDAGLRLLERDRPDFMYLSLSDYVQHKHAPGSPAANAFYRTLDARFGQFAAAGALVALTADHGMNFKPHVIFLQDILDTHFGTGGTRMTRVICPITDPYVVHHGALGSFVRVYCPAVSAPMARDMIQELPGVAAVYERSEACRIFGLPADREGDLIVIGDRETVLGTTETEHDLSGLGDTPLRSHGGLTEQQVPFILSQPLSEAYASRARTEQVRNFDILDYALNGTV